MHMAFGALGFRVTEVDDVGAIMRGLEYDVEDDEVIEGAWLPEERSILIRRGQSASERTSTLFHELLHAAGVEDEALCLALEQQLAPLLISQGWQPWPLEAPPEPDARSGKSPRRARPKVSGSSRGGDGSRSGRRGTRRG